MYELMTSVERSEQTFVSVGWTKNRCGQFDDVVGCDVDAEAAVIHCISCRRKKKDCHYFVIWFTGMILILCLFNILHKKLVTSRSRCILPFPLPPFLSVVPKNELKPNWLLV